MSSAPPVYGAQVGDLLDVYLHTDGDGDTTLRIETLTSPVRAMVTLNKEQAGSLLNCLYLGVVKWERKAP